MSLSSVIVDMLQRTWDRVRVRRRFVLGDDPFLTPAAPTLDDAINPPAAGPTATWTDSAGIFSANSVQYGFIFYDPNYGQGTDITTARTVDFADLGDGSAVIENIPTLPDTAQGMQVWLVRLDSNVGTWALVANVTGQTTFLDEGQNGGDWYGANGTTFSYAIGFEEDGQVSVVGDTANHYGYWFADRRLTGFPSTPVGATRWLLRFDDWNASQWVKVADVTGVDEYTDSNADAYTSGEGYWTVNDPGAQTVTPGGLVLSVNGSAPDPTTGDVYVYVPSIPNGLAYLANTQAFSGANTISSTLTVTGLGTFSRLLNSTSGTDYGFRITPTVNQTSGTAGYTGMLVNVTATAAGSGSQLLADFQISGVSKVKIDRMGQIGVGMTPAVPIDVNGQIRASTGYRFGFCTLQDNVQSSGVDGIELVGGGASIHASWHRGGFNSSRHKSGPYDPGCARIHPTRLDRHENKLSWRQRLSFR